MAEKKGLFLKTCNITLHDDKGGPSHVYDIHQRRYVTTAIYDYIIANKLLKGKDVKRTQHICDECLQKISKNMRTSEKRPRTETSDSPRTRGECGVEPSLHQLNEAISMICSSIDSDALTVTQLTLLMNAICKKVRRDIESHVPAGPSKRLDEIYAGSYSDIWKAYPDNTWKKMLTGVSGPGESNETCRKLVKCTEIVHSVAKPNYISNISLGEALLLLQFSHSHLSVSLLSKIIPCGSYWTLRRTIADLGKNPKTLPENDVIIAFDNNQVIQKTWMIQYKGKQPMSTVTTMIYFFDRNSSSRHQFDMDIPTVLLPTTRNADELMARYHQFTSNASNIHRQYRRSFLEEKIAKVTSACNLVDGVVQDSISLDTCKTTLFDETLEYKRVVANPRCSDIIDLDCVEENPNSYLSVSKVLDKILHLMESTSRKYIHVVADGSPYYMAIRIIRDTYLCGTCQTAHDVSKRDEHEAKEHLIGNVIWARKYKKIIMRPGNGHIEMNAVRAITSFFWTPFIKPIAKIMGYASEASLDYCRKSYDHHKGYYLLMVIFAALSDELVYAFVKDCMQKGTQPTYDGFCAWEKRVSEINLTYRLAMDFTFTTLHSLHLFRCAIRQCNDDVALAAREKLTSLFYITNHNKYQKIICNDTLYLLSLPKDAKRIIGNESSRRFGGENGEGYDFLLEGRNKLYKSFLPTDTSPTFDSWLHVSRNANNLQKLRSAAAQRLELSEPNHSQHFRKLGLEVHEARKFVRSLHVFEDKNVPLLTLDDAKTPLDLGVLNFILYSDKNKLKFYESYCKLEDVNLQLLNVDVLEFNKDSVTVPELKTAITSKLNALKAPLQNFYKSCFRKLSTVSDLLEFYKTLQNQVNIQTQIDFDDFEGNGMFSEQG